MKNKDLTTATLRLHAIAVILILFSLEISGIERYSQCSMEEDACGWSLGESVDGRYTIGRGQANSAPGPPVDAAPGTTHGHYVYLNYTALPSFNRETMLSFPTYRYICRLSLSYYMSASLDISILRVNIGRTALPASIAQWRFRTVDYVPQVEDEDRDHSLKILIEGFELGEAEEEGDDSLVAAVDNITLTFCLPCDFDILPLPGNLMLTAPTVLNVSLGYVTNFTLSASSPLCPSLPLFFTIEAVEPPSLAGIFSVDSDSGLMIVDGTGPHLLAAGALGYVKVSVHVVDSNYTQSGPPYKTTATITLEQDPVIRLHDTPTELTVEVNVPFSLQLHAAHILPSSQSLTYHLSTSSNSLHTHISIDHLGKVTGVITIDTVPDILRMGGANMTVGVVNEFGSSVNLTITLLFPPTPPLSLESNLTFSVSENHSAAMHLHPVSTLTLIDPNGDPVAVPFTEWFGETFELYPLGSEEGHEWYWEGRLFVDQTQLDYENQSSYSLPLTVSDTVNSSLTTTLYINVIVKSENEHAPKFVNFKDSQHIQASWSVDSLVVSEKATDQDLGPAGEITYDITHGNENQFFRIDESGDVRVASSPLLPGEYQLTITALDHGTPPFSTSGVLTITVEAVGQVDCGNSVDYDVPAIHSIGIDDSHVRTPVGSNATLYCSYQANPAVALYKWDVNPIVPPATFSYVYPLPPSHSPHVALLPHQLTLMNVRASDAAFYECSVTNWCGTTTAIHVLFIIDYPLSVNSLSWQTVQSPDNILYPTSINISWTSPSRSSSPSSTPGESPSPLVVVTADYYLVQVMLFDLDDSYHDVAKVPTSSTNVMVGKLLPGNGYYIRVASVNEAGATSSDSITISLPPTTPKLASVDTRQEANLSLLIMWELAYDGGYPITQFTVTITPQSPRTRRQEGGVVYHVDSSAGSLLSRPLPAGRRYLVTLSLENSIGTEDYSLSEYVGHVDRVQCDFEPQQHCPWRLVEGSLINTVASGGVVEAVIGTEGSRVILRHTAAGYSCGYGFSYQLWGGAGLQVRVVGGGGGVVWEEYGDTEGEWKQVTMSEAVDVDYLTPTLHNNLEMVATSNGSGGGVRLDMLLLDFCLPCDVTTLQQPGEFSLTYSTTVTLYYREVSQLLITASLTDCPTAVIDIESFRVVPSVLGRYVSTEVKGHNVSLSVEPIPSDIAVQTGLIQVHVYVVGSDYASPAGDMSTAVGGVAEIEFIIEEQGWDSNCSDVISCGFEGGTCGWSLGANTTLIDTGNNGFGVQLSLSDSHTGDVVLSYDFLGDQFCHLSLSYMTQGVELVVTVSGVGVVWSSGTNDISELISANFTFDLQASSALKERTVVLSVGEVWNRDGTLLLLTPTLYPCLPCRSPTSPAPATPAECPTEQTCPDNNSNGSLVAAVGGLTAAVVILLTCYLCTVVCLLRMYRRVSVREKYLRQGDRQRLMSDEDSIGTASSVSRASHARDRRRWKKYGESSTLMTFVPEDDSMSKASREESSWLQAVELTHTQPPGGAEGGMVRGLGGRGEVLQNPLYEDEDEEDGEEGVELSARERDWALPPPSSPCHSSDL